MAKDYDNRQFNKDFKKLTEGIIKALSEAETIDIAQPWLDMLNGLSSHENSPATAKAIYGHAYLMEDKPWYDFRRGMTALKEAAAAAPDNEPFCWYIIGMIYLNGLKDLPQDSVQAKYWIEKAAAVGYKDAQVVKAIQWGDNPPGFKEWFIEHLEKREMWRQRFCYALPILTVAIIVVLFFIFS